MKDLLPLNEEPWRLEAACRGQRTELFYPEKHEHDKREEALSFCDVCPVTEPCLAYALQRSLQEDAGVWGGTTQRDRRKIRTARNAKRRLEVVKSLTVD